MINREYRKEIDGIRAIAVLSVILFHFEFFVFSGGFIGVDIFFVISGFLITQNIMYDFQNNKFSLKTFYIKRIRRLFPALFVVLFVVLLFGFIFFSPEHYLRLAKTTIYSLFSVSNIFFWTESGYFDTSVDFKPLLHTWSLSVEEQFYLVWPLILIFLLSLKNRLYIIVFLIISFILSILFSEIFLKEDASLVFYFMPFRVFEFAIGALLVFIVDSERKVNNFIKEILLFIGLSFIVTSIFFYNHNTPLPGVYALLPIIGTVLLIFAGNSKYLGILLKNRISFFLGLISYSLYLVHWPLYVFYKYWKYENLNIYDQIFLIISTFLLSFLLYYFVEAKFRFKKNNSISNKTFFIIWIPSIISVIIFSFLIINYNGLTVRLDSKVNLLVNNSKQYHIDYFGGSGYKSNDFELLGDKNVKEVSFYLIGDSYALQYAYGFDKILKNKKMSALMLGDHCCVIGPKITRLISGKSDISCAKQFDKIVEKIKLDNKPIVFAQYWSGYDGLIGTYNDREIETNLSYNDYIISNIKNIKEIFGERKLFIVGNQPGSGNENGVLPCIQRPMYIKNNCIEKLSFDEKFGKGLAINKKLFEYSESDNDIVFLDSYEVFCENNICKSVNLVDNEIFYSDGNHFSKDGSLKVSNLFIEKILGVMNE